VFPRGNSEGFTGAQPAGNPEESPPPILKASNAGGHRAHRGNGDGTRRVWRRRCPTRVVAARTTKSEVIDVGRRRSPHGRGRAARDGHGGRRARRRARWATWAPRTDGVHLAFDAAAPRRTDPAGRFQAKSAPCPGRTTSCSPPTTTSRKRLRTAASDARPLQLRWRCRWRLSCPDSLDTVPSAAGEPAASRPILNNGRDMVSAGGWLIV
jgi:hypothetical protein